MHDISLIYTTCGNKAEAEGLAKMLLAEKLIACANILPAHTAVYTWQAALAMEEEVGMLLKTSLEQTTAAIAFTKEKHSYDTPAIVSWTASADIDFGMWVQENTQK